MGTHTTAETVKNAAYVGELTERFEAELSDDVFEDFEENGMEQGFTYRGWQLIDGSKKYGRLYVDVFQKDGHQICLINSSQYALVGEEEYVVFGDDRVAVEAFLKDWEIDEEISDQDAITQTF